jgi:hypothetical protein
MGGTCDVSREQLYRELWSEPTTTVAKRYGISDVGLAKVCRRYDIPKPGLGYWAKVKHGKPVKKILLPPAPRGTPAVLSIRAREEEEAPDVRRACVVEQWLDRENLPAFQIAAPLPGNWRHPLSIASEKALRQAKPHTGGWLVAPPGCLAVRVSPAMLPRALAIMDAVVTACEARGWPVTTEFQMPRRLGWNGTFWYPGRAWVTTLPPQPRALTGVGLLKNHVWFSIREVSRMGPPSPEEIRAHHREFPWGGDPPPRPEPNGVLLFELDRFPRVNARYRFKDLKRRPIESQLNSVMVAIIQMADGIRADQLREAVELRNEKRAVRRRNEREHRRQILRADIALLRKGVRRWRWQLAAGGFLALVHEQAAIRQVSGDEFARWLAWAEAYVQGEGFDQFFEQWATGPNARRGETRSPRELPRQADNSKEG